VDIKNRHKKDQDIVNRVVGSAFEEVEKFGESAAAQISANVDSSQPDPIAEAMQQKTESEEIEKQNKIDRQRKFIQTQEQLNEELKKVQTEDQEKRRVWNEEVERQFKIVGPGESLEEKPVIPLTSKPKMGQMRGRPGTAKGETGPEIRKSKQ